MNPQDGPCGKLLSAVKNFLELRVPDRLESRIRCRYRQCSAPNFHAASGKGGSRHFCRGLVVFGKTLLFSH